MTAFNTMSSFSSFRRVVSGSVSDDPKESQRRIPDGVINQNSFHSSLLIRTIHFARARDTFIITITTPLCQTENLTCCCDGQNEEIKEMCLLRFNNIDDWYLWFVIFVYGFLLILLVCSVSRMRTSMTRWHFKSTYHLKHPWICN